eukprot:CAMPEP_0203676152 /NCGR_PEP_ID=MMETSP0090-20130426/23578_1 /ASSEMBLY_ACC=CAM_ASM_001088 /TAXON_ID=426623 /ORGANISM="Chaetoceros affinis, Strain CCMP159" /LENGTH=234 /DNA_ID=CAMNT_0050542597 /DNA_START=204 /DNA_END=908 /DNA_ORIENTATION=-
MNGWQDGVLQNIIDNCPVIRDGEAGYNPPCNCAEEFLTENSNPSGAVCDNDVKRYIVNEPTDVVTTLPRGTCNGPSVITKSWDVDPPFACDDSPIPAPAPTPTVPNPNPNPTPPFPTPTLPAPTPTVPAPTPDDDDNGNECSDSPFEFVFRGEFVNCAWVEGEGFCSNAKLSEMCPFTCGTCDECADSRSRFEFEDPESGRTIVRKCRYVARNDEERCGIPGISDTCRDTCGSC